MRGMAFFVVVLSLGVNFIRVSPSHFGRCIVNYEFVLGHFQCYILFQYHRLLVSEQQNELSRNVSYGPSCIDFFFWWDFELAHIIECLFLTCNRLPWNFIKVRLKVFRKALTLENPKQLVKAFLVCKFCFHLVAPFPCIKA